MNSHPGSITSVTIGDIQLKIEPNIIDIHSYYRAKFQLSITKMKVFFACWKISRAYSAA